MRKIHNEDHKCRRANVLTISFTSFIIRARWTKLFSEKKPKCQDFPVCVNYTLTSEWMESILYKYVPTCKKETNYKLEEANCMA